MEGKRDEGGRGWRGRRAERGRGDPPRQRFWSFLSLDYTLSKHCPYTVELQPYLTPE